MVANNRDFETGNYAFEMTREFKASRQRLWQAWSQADQLDKWWGPEGCTIEIPRFEFRPGGFLHYAMKFPNAPTMWGRFNYREIVPDERIIWLNSFSNERCGIARAPFSEVCPLEIENTVTFTEQDGVTTVALHSVPFGESAAEREFFENLRASMEKGFGGTFRQLEEYLAKG